MENISYTFLKYEIAGYYGEPVSKYNTERLIMFPEKKKGKKSRFYTNNRKSIREYLMRNGYTEEEAECYIDSIYKEVERIEKDANDNRIRNRATYCKLFH